MKGPGYLQASGATSIVELARTLGRDMRSVQEDAGALADWGPLERTDARSICVPDDVIQIDFDLKAAA